MKQKMLVACVIWATVMVGCNKNQPTTEDSAAAKPDAAGRVAYVSDQEQYVQSLQQEISIDDPDALLDDLNESAGDNSHNAELVRLKSVEASPQPEVVPVEQPPVEDQAEAQ